MQPVLYDLFNINARTEKVRFPAACRKRGFPQLRGDRQGEERNTTPEQRCERSIDGTAHVNGLKSESSRWNRVGTSGTLEQDESRVFGRFFYARIQTH